MLLEGVATRLIGIDRDTDALAIARQALSEFGDRVTHGPTRTIARIAGVLGAQEVGEGWPGARGLRGVSMQP